MRNSQLLLLAGVFLLGGLVGLLLIQSTTASQEDSQSQAQLATQVSSMVAQFKGLGEQVATLEQRLDALPAPESAKVLQRSLDAAEVERLVAEALAKNLGSTVSSDPLSKAAEASARESEADLLNRSIGRFLDPSLSQKDREALWDELQEQGLLEQAIALLENEVEANPENLALMNQLGFAYLQPIMRGGVAGMDAGKWSMKADQTYDRILAADAQNWEARFSKAVSYSFWPPMFGKQPEAIRHFEILVGQQAGQTTQPQFAQTHLLLGNLYEQSGDHEKAVAAWQAGISRFPEDAALRKQLGLE